MELWDHQKQASNEAKLYDKRMLAWDPRIGKTLGAIECTKEWGGEKLKGIVVAPLVVCPDWVKILVAQGYWVLDCTERPVRDLQRAIKPWEGVLVLNYEKLAPLIETLLKSKRDFLIIDESHWIKSPSAKRARAARRLAWNTKYVRLLTGTPAPNNMGDLWGQMTCVDPELWEKSYGKFANKYLIRHPLYSSKIIGYKDLPGIESKFKAGAHIKRREDVFGPDEYQFVRRGISLPDSAALLYRKLAKTWILDTPLVSAEHIFKRLVRLQQLSSGYLRLDDGTIQEIHTAKIDAVMADLDEIFESGEKVILFHIFRWEGDRYEQEIRKLFPNVVVGRIQGGDNTDDRTRAISLIEEGVGPSVILAQTRAGGIGISLRKARYVGIISSGYSFTARKQAIDRVYAPGEGRCVTDYVVTGTVEVVIEQAIKNKSDLYNSIRNLGLEQLVYGT